VYQHAPGLRSTTAYCLAHLANIECGETVLDPLCGKGSILVEAACAVPGAFYMGGDTDVVSLQHASENLAKASVHRVDLVTANALAFPVADGTIDVVLSDLPFGRKHALHGDGAEFVHLFVKQVLRVLRRDEGRAVVLTAHPGEVVAALGPVPHFALPFRLGALHAHAVVFGCLARCRVLQPDKSLPPDDDSGEFEAKRPRTGEDI
jgi:tRNA G10  N-methylase Trm11